MTNQHTTSARGSRRRGRGRSFGSHPAAVWAIKHVASPIDRLVVRVSGGRLRPPTSIAVPTLLLTTVGRRTGEERTIPLVFVRNGDGYIVGNARPAGERRNPWVLNLRASGRGVVREGRRHMAVTARELDGRELEQRWSDLVEVWPALADHFADTGERTVFALDPSQPPPSAHGGVAIHPTVGTGHTAGPTVGVWADRYVPGTVVAGSQ